MQDHRNQNDVAKFIVNRNVVQTLQKFIRLVGRIIHKAPQLHKFKHPLHQFFDFYIASCCTKFLVMVKFQTTLAKLL
jgi:hypothetical protein